MSWAGLFQAFLPGGGFRVNPPHPVHPSVQIPAVAQPPVGGGPAMWVVELKSVGSQSQRRVRSRPFVLKGDVAGCSALPVRERLPNRGRAVIWQRRPREAKCVVNECRVGIVSTKERVRRSDVWLPCRKLVFRAGRFLPCKVDASLVDNGCCKIPFRVPMPNLMRSGRFLVCVPSRDFSARKRDEIPSQTPQRSS